MTDKQQPPTAPERSRYDGLWGREIREAEAKERAACVHPVPVDDARVEEIAERQRRRKEDSISIPGPGLSEEQKAINDIDYLLSLLPHLPREHPVINPHIETAILALQNQARWWLESVNELGVSPALAKARAGEAESVVNLVLSPLLYTHLKIGGSTLAESPAVSCEIVHKQSN